MDVARLNMSHGTHADHSEVYRRVREASEATGHAVAVLADLQGPKIRLRRFSSPAVLRRGQRWTITTREVDGNGEICATSYAGLPGDVRPGDPILIDDGKVRLRVVEVSETDVVTEVLVGGPVSTSRASRSPCRRCPRRTPRTCASPCTWAPT